MAHGLATTARSRDDYAQVPIGLIGMERPSRGSLVLAHPA